MTFEEEDVENTEEETRMDEPTEREHSEKEVTSEEEEEERTETPVPTTSRQIIPLQILMKRIGADEAKEKSFKELFNDFETVPTEEEIKKHFHAGNSRAVVHKPFYCFLGRV